MLIHIVCWRYKAEVDAASRQEHINRLRRLTPLFPDIQSFHVGSDILHLDRSYDTGLMAIFKDRESLDSYTVHPEHQKVAAMGREIAAAVVSVDFMTE